MPTLATNVKFGMDSLGKMVFVKFGILPKAVGPKIIPPKTSPITLGCLIKDKG